MRERNERKREKGKKKKKWKKKKRKKKGGEERESGREIKRKVGGSSNGMRCDSKSNATQIYDAHKIDANKTLIYITHQTKNKLLV